MKRKCVEKEWWLCAYYYHFKHPAEKKWISPAVFILAGHTTAGDVMNRRYRGFWHSSNSSSSSSFFLLDCHPLIEPPLKWRDDSNCWSTFFYIYIQNSFLSFFFWLVMTTTTTQWRVLPRIFQAGADECVLVSTPPLGFYERGSIKT